MNEEKGELCDVWEQELVKAEAHSHFYHLPPVGVGTPMVESLTSYVMRLAEAHSVYPAHLLTKEFHPLSNHSSLSPNNILSHYFSVDSACLNSAAPITVGLLVQILEQLTFRNDLRFLTMLPFKDVLSQRNLMRHSKAWCSTCYEEWRKADQVIYEPLLWSIKCVSRCPLHNQPLHLRCPNLTCARLQYPLDLHGQPGYCMSCKRWLASTAQSDEKECVASEDEYRWQQWMSHTIGALLSAAPTFSQQLSRDTFSTTLSTYIKEKARNKVSVLARNLPVNSATLYNWLHRINIPEIGTLLQVCSHLNISPLYILTGEGLRENKFPLKRCNLSKLDTHKTNNIQKITVDTEKIKNTLNAALQEVPPPSLAEIGRRLEGPQYKNLYKYFPDLCRTISARRLEYRSQRSLERQRRIIEQIQQAVQTINTQGHYPSQQRVETSLQIPRLFMTHEFKEVWKNSLRELEL